jgi:hypothetical protein
MAGRRLEPIDWEQFDKLCHFQSTLEEIAAWFDCSIDTIEKRVLDTHGMAFAEYTRQKRCKGKVSLRRRQFQAAMDGNTAMLIWLGKQYLKQSDHSLEVDAPAGSRLIINMGGVQNGSETNDQTSSSVSSEDKAEDSSLSTLLSPGPSTL